MASTSTTVGDVEKPMGEINIDHRDAVETQPQTPPNLPDELWLHILNYLGPHDLWLSRLTNKQLFRTVEDICQSPNGHISHFTVGATYSLGSGSHHRWYDIWATITFRFQSFNRHNPQYALFGGCAVKPPSCHTRAMETWKRMCSGNRIGMRQDWRVQCRLEGEEGDVRIVRLPNLMAAGEEGEGVWVDWREMLNAYSRLESKVRSRRDGEG